MTKQTLTFSAAVAAVALLVLLVLQSPQPRANADADPAVASGGGSGHPSFIGPVTPSQGGGAHGSWSHGISFDQFTRLVQQHASSPPTPGASPSVTSGLARVVEPSSTSSAAREISESAPISPASPVKNRLSSLVPAEVRRWEALIDKYADLNAVDPNLVAAMMVTESRGNPAARSSMGAVGLMQVVNGPPDPEANVSTGAQIIASNLKRYGGDVELSLAAYNAGAGAVDRYGGVPPFLETETYVYLVLNRYFLYQNG